jgi:hypothetical protein
LARDRKDKCRVGTCVRALFQELAAACRECSLVWSTRPFLNHAAVTLNSSLFLPLPPYTAAATVAVDVTIITAIY